MMIIDMCQSPRKIDEEVAAAVAMGLICVGQGVRGDTNLYLIYDENNPTNRQKFIQYMKSIVDNELRTNRRLFTFKELSDRFNLSDQDIESMMQEIADETGIYPAWQDVAPLYVIDRAIASMNTTTENLE